MKTILSLVKAVVSCLAPEDEVNGVTAKPIDGGVNIVIYPRTVKAAGSIIGRRGETIHAIRHLASRAGKRVEPRLETVVVTVAEVTP